jgi:2-oxoglutarate decarboxylase
LSNTDENSQNEFGANQWLVEEMYEQWVINPDAVDKEWWPILERYHATQPSSASSSAPAIAETTPNAQIPAPAPTHEAATVNEQPSAAPAHVEPVEGSQLVAKTTRVEAKPQPIPAQAPITGLIDTVEDGEDQVTALKGMSKALAANMDASLAVPTATSVRTIPAKLLIDNRIVINSHLGRTRGGKVSFTHILGFALILSLIHI